MIALVIVLIGLGCYCGWRYYNDVYKPNSRILDADKSQRELFDRLKPDFEDPGETGSEIGVSDPEAAAVEDDPLIPLASVNGGTVGWLTIDGTVIDYPISQADDNSFYLDHGYDGQYNWGVGTPFLDYRCSGDFSGFNSIVYAHHIQGYRALFSDITLYKDKSFMESCPTGNLMTKSGMRTVRFFAYLIIPNPSFAYNTEFADQSEKEAYIDELYETAEYTYAFTAEELKNNKNLHLLLLSTCTYEYWDARGVLAGVIE